MKRKRKKEEQREKKRGRMAVFAGRPYDAGRGLWVVLDVPLFFLFLICLSEARRLIPGYTTLGESHKRTRRLDDQVAAVLCSTWEMARQWQD